MRSKAPLALMEQMVMIVVFALAAALCLQAFVRSDSLSRRGEARDQAVILAQSAAEAVRHTGGDLPAALTLVAGVEGTDGCVDFDASWAPVADGGVYRLRVERLDSDTPGLGLAAVAVTIPAEDDTLFNIEVAWQEVSGHG